MIIGYKTSTLHLKALPPEYSVAFINPALKCSNGSDMGLVWCSQALSEMFAGLMMHDWNIPNPCRCQRSISSQGLSQCAKYLGGCTFDNIQALN